MGVTARVSWEDCQMRPWWGDSSEGRVWTSDRDRGQTLPSHCQPVHSDEVKLGHQPVVQGQWGPWLGTAAVWQEMVTLQAVTGGHGLRWDGSWGQEWGRGGFWWGWTWPAKPPLPSAPWWQVLPRRICPPTPRLRWDLLKSDLIAVGCRVHFGGYGARAGTRKWERDTVGLIGARCGAQADPE